MWLVALVLAWVQLARADGPPPLSSEPWQLAGEAWWVDEPVVVSQRTGTLVLQSGYVFRIDDEAGPVGAVFVGDGTWAVHFEDGREGRRFANRRVLAEGDDAPGLAEVARGRPWETVVDRGLLVGVDLWPSMLPGLVEVVRDGGVLLETEPGAVEELLVVPHDRLGPARRAARRLLDHRTQHARTHRFDPASWVGLDRIEGCRTAADGAQACNRYADLRTSATWDRYAGVDFVGAGGRWLSWLRDPRGLLGRDAPKTVR